MDAATAHDEVDKLFADVQHAVGGDWQSLDGGAESCALASGGTGAQYPFGRLGPGLPDADRKAIVEQVAQQWRDADLHPVISELPPVDGVAVTQVRYPASGYTDDGLYVAFGASANATSLEGQSRCGAGNADELNESSG